IEATSGRSAWGWRWSTSARRGAVPKTSRRRTSATTSARWHSTARARTGTTVLMPNEWLMAQRRGRDWGYVVEHAATAAELSVAQDPAAKLHPDEVVEVVRYVIWEWKAAAAGWKA